MRKSLDSAMEIGEREGTNPVTNVLHQIHRALYGLWAAVVTRAGYAFMRLTEPWTPYVRVHGLRLLPCSGCPEDGLAHMERVLEALHQREPAALAALPARLRYLSTVDGERPWPYQHIPEMRILRWSLHHLETAPLEDHLSLLRRLAITGKA